STGRRDRRRRTAKPRQRKLQRPANCCSTGPVNSRLLHPQMLFAGEHRQLKAAIHAQLSIDVAEVAFDGLFADGKLAGDLAVAIPFLDSGDDLNLTRGEAETR